jgi:dTMP kinase
VGEGLLISFEGLDGAGKTTQLELLERWLIVRGIAYVRTREPGGTPLGEEVRALLLHRPDLEITPLAEAFLFQADRAQHFATKVVPALQSGMVVVTDRCLDSSIAYQGVARGIGGELIEQLSLLATEGRLPDLTIFLDLDPELVSRRVNQGRNQEGDLGERLTCFDRESAQFHQRLRSAFLTLAQAHPQRIRVIDATQTVEVVHQRIIALLEPLLPVNEREG